MRFWNSRILEDCPDGRGALHELEIVKDGDGEGVEAGVEFHG